jgi:hypothetical protein
VDRFVLKRLTATNAGASWVKENRSGADGKAIVLPARI